MAHNNSTEDGHEEERQTLLSSLWCRDRTRGNGLKLYQVVSLKTEQGQLSCPHKKDAPVPYSSLQPSAGPAPETPRLSCPEEPRTGHSTPNAASLGDERVRNKCAYSLSARICNLIQPLLLPSSQISR
ncbi:hypothetical protein HGM15179_012510 [Zosterops borbonicus]|uniref:Uncharacterized protein n=1 Tax=Zosterops borbonicus TaxID=364589 RepID=A0A8K1G9Q2_9PASS|nr:hypothetical protein HGM15179_012510 [Zosterops borbonicus]